MKRGELYRVYKPTSRDPKKFRVFVVVSRQSLIDSKFSTVICAPIYSEHHGLSTQLMVGLDEGLKQDSSIYCDELISLPKSSLSRFVGTLSHGQIRQLDRALVVALGISGVFDEKGKAYSYSNSRRS